MASMNIIFNHPIIGEVSLRPLMIRDFTNTIQLLRTTDDYLFCCHIINQQITKPKVSLTDIQKWHKSTLIQVAREFAKREKTVSSHFYNADDQNFFTDFKRAFKSYHTEWSARLVKMLLPLEEIGKSFSQFTNTISAAIEAYYEPVRFVAESLQKNLSDIQQAMEPIWKIIADFTRQYVETFTKLTKIWVEIEKKYKISKEEGVRILKRYKWCISPSLPMEFIFSVVSIGKKPGDHRKEMNQLFTQYLCRNNFRNLKMMVESWKNKPLFSPRIKIIRDTLAIFMKGFNTRRNYYTVIIPTLLTQIDGIFSKILEKNNINIKKMTYAVKKEKFSKMGKSVIDKELQELIQYTFLEILFKRAYYGDTTGYSFNRHKILHGEYLRYGRKKNVLRAFLILDFLSCF